MTSKPKTTVPAKKRPQPERKPAKHAAAVRKAAAAPVAKGKARKPPTQPAPKGGQGGGSPALPVGSKGHSEKHAPEKHVAEKHAKPGETVQAKPQSVADKAEGKKAPLGIERRVPEDRQ